MGNASRDMHGQILFDLPILKSFPILRICMPQFGQEKLIKLESSKFCLILVEIQLLIGDKRVQK